MKAARRLSALRFGKPRRSDPAPEPAAICYEIFKERIGRRWSFAPVPGEEICNDLTLFHDAGNSLFYWSQGRAPSLVLTTYQFLGTYVSLAAGMPAATVASLGPGSRIDVKMKITSTRPLTTFLRLNLDLPEGRELLHETLVIDRSDKHARFDLAGARGSVDSARNAWLDIIFSDPSMSEIAIKDLQLNVCND